VAREVSSMNGRKRLTVGLLIVVCALDVFVVSSESLARDQTFGAGNTVVTPPSPGSHGGGHGGLGIGVGIGIGSAIGSRLSSGSRSGDDTPARMSGIDQYPPCRPGRMRLCRIVHRDTPSRHKCPPGKIGKYPKCKTIRKVAVNTEREIPKTRKTTPPSRNEPVTKKNKQVVKAPRQLPPLRQTKVVNTIPRFRPGELLVVVRGQNPDMVAGQLGRSFNLTLRETVTLALLPNARVFRFSIPDNRSVEVLATAVSTTANVSAMPNFYYALQRNTKAKAGAAVAAKAHFDKQYALEKMHVPDAQGLATGDGVVVAVIDSGVDARHPALAGVNLTLLDATENVVQDADPHGTAITGIIAGKGDMKGIAPDAAIIAIRAFAHEGGHAPVLMSASSLWKAVDSAFQKGARVFNMSFSGPREPVLLGMIEAAYAQGATFVAAAGNDGPDAPPVYPAAYEKVIAVTATDAADHLYVKANRGNYVAVAAPGVDIYAPITEEGFDYLSGTSFAAAHVTGIVALLRQRNPQLSPEEIRQILTRTAHSLPDEGTSDVGVGLADALASLKRMQTLAHEK
jgi:hypothetical protein